MTNIKHLITRGEDSGLNTTHVALLISLIMLLLVAMVLIGALMYLRSMRRARKQAEADAQLPVYEKRQSNHSRNSRLTITTMPYQGRESIVLYSEKQDLMSNSSSPDSPVPEIRITFPDEVDASGKQKSGRVVVVRVGEHSVGLEPLNEDLPAYERDSSDRFDSLDLDRIGGLKEKDEKDRYYS